MDRKRWAAKKLKKRVAVLWSRYWPTYTFAGLSVFLLAFSSSDQGRYAADPASVSLLPAVITEDTDAVASQDPWKFFRPSWQEGAPWNLVPLRTSNYDPFTDTPVNNSAWIDDPYDRIEKDFKVPTSLKPQVAFWMDIYSRFSSRIRIVHDRNNVNLVYGYIDFRPLYRVTGSQVKAAAIAGQLEKKIIKRLQANLSEAAGLTKTATLSTDEREELRRFLSKNGAFSKKEAAALIETMRTQTGQSDMFLMALYRSRQLLPHIEAVFRQQNLPVALARIPFVESSFNTKAESKIGAVGIWQFMPETARQMIHSEQENLWSDPLRQTRSAVKLLKIYRSLLPDWAATVTAYNSGVGRIRRLVEKTGLKRGEDLAHIPAARDTLGFAGRNFYAEFLAANIVEAYKEEIFKHLLVPTQNSLVYRTKEAIPKESCDL